MLHSELVLTAGFSDMKLQSKRTVEIQVYSIQVRISQIWAKVASIEDCAFTAHCCLQSKHYTNLAKNWFHQRLCLYCWLLPPAQTLLLLFAVASTSDCVLILYCCLHCLQYSHVASVADCYKPQGTHRQLECANSCVAETYLLRTCCQQV